MKTSEISIKSQLWTGFGIILLLIMLLGYISSRQAGIIAQQTVDMYEHPLQVRRAIGELKSNILLIHNGLQDLGTVSGEQEIYPILAIIELHKTGINSQINILEDRYLGPKADIENLRNDFIKWTVICDETVRLFHQGRLKEVIKRNRLDGVGGKSVETLLTNLQKVDNFARNMGEQFFTKAINKDRTLNRELAIIVAGIFLFSFFVLFLLFRNIRIPVTNLKTFIDQFKSGNLAARSAYVSTNEFGLLSTSFNELADTIETEMTLNGQAASLSEIMLREDDAARFCHDLLTTLIESTGSQIGAIYVLNEEKTEFEHFKSIGMESSACSSFSALSYEGEFGVAISTKKLQHITSIPEETRFMFSTVSGKFIPCEIITIPVVAANETIALISLANIKKYSDKSLQFLNMVIGTISARMDGILAYRRVIAFSHKLESQNTELETQKSELSSQAKELTEQNVELEMQKNQLDEANRLKTTFLSNMSHELRTPLNSVIALSGVLNRRLEGTVPDEEYSYLEVIERNGKQLLALINNILDISRIEAGWEEIEIRSFNFHELVTEVVEMIEPTAKEKNIELLVTKTGDLPDVLSDYDKCRHILQNILMNAVKFTEAGKVEIKMEATAETIRISVTDTGIGIEKENLTRIFDEFRQADASNSRKYGGSGLGLTIAKKYAELLGGNISVESTLGKGSEFTLTLPVHFASDRDHVPLYDSGMGGSVTQSLQSKRKFNSKEKTILLVEDSEAAIIQMKDILTTEGYNVIIARNGSEALEQIAQKIPDGMILDLMMPGIDGFEVLRIIREEIKTARLPVIILTAKYITKDELAFLKHNNIHQLIQKGGINHIRLLEEIAQMMNPAENEQDQPQKKLTPIRFTGDPVVMIVEDNPDNMLTIKALLPGNFKIVEALDGKSVLKLAKKHKPHLILMDIALPELNGIEVLKLLRKDELLQKTPVIAVSASAMKGDRESFIAQGFDGYVPKPIDGKLFAQVIGEWIGNKV